MRVCDSISAVNEAIRYGTPWTAFLEYRGPNDKVACGFSDKWWEITGTSDGRVEINYGASGSAGLSSPGPPRPAKSCLEHRSGPRRSCPIS